MAVGVQSLVLAVLPIQVAENARNMRSPSLERSSDRRSDIQLQPARSEVSEGKDKYGNVARSPEPIAKSRCHSSSVQRSSTLNRNNTNVMWNRFAAIQPWRIGLVHQI